jgi:Zn-dependent protease
VFDFSIASLISRAIILLVAMAVHEYAHARVAYAFGDDTAKSMGRMTLDPRANIYLPGFLIGVLIGFAVLGSAPVNPYRMRNRRWGMFFAVLAGPVSNLLVAVVAAVPFWLGLLTPTLQGSIGGIVPTLDRLLTEMMWLNILLFVFNLLPLSPLDGWTVTLAALPPRAAIWWQRNQQISQYVLFGLIALSFIAPQLTFISPLLRYADLLGLIIGQPSLFLMRLLLGL